MTSRKTLHWESKSNQMAELQFAGKNNSISHIVDFFSIPEVNNFLEDTNKKDH